MTIARWLVAAGAVLGAVTVESRSHPVQTPTQAALRVEADAAVTASEHLVNQSRYQDARDQAVRALELCEQLQDLRGIGRARHVLGLAATMMGDHAEARVHFEAAISVFDSVEHRRGRGKATLGLLRIWSPDSGTATRWLERTVNDARSADDKDLEARALHAWGDRLFWAGEYEAAFEKLEQAGLLFTGTGDALALGTVHNSMGRLYRRHGRADLALEQQLTALSLHEKFPTTFEYVQSLNAVAVTYQALGDIGRARTYLDRALILAEQMSSPQILDFIRGSLAAILIDQGEPARAARLLENVVANGLDSQPSVRQAALAEAYLGMGRHEDALRAAQAGVDLCRDGSATDCLLALSTRSRVHAGGHNRPAALADLRAAIDHLEEARRRLVPADFLKQQFAVPQQAIYSRAIAFQFGEGRTAEALETAERARARAFIDLLAANQITAPDPPQAGGPPLSADSGTLPLLLRGADTPAGGAVKPAAPRADLPSPGSAPAADAPDIAALAARLRSTLLVYWVADHELFIWLVGRRGQIHAARVPVRAARLRDLVRATAPFAANSRRGEKSVVTRGQGTIALQSTDTAAWRQLYELLIRPVRRALPETDALLTIVPHGPLTSLSFAALVNERGRYLLEDYALHHVPAARVLHYTAERQLPAPRTGTVILVADPTPPARSRIDQALPPLPGARAEARAISRIIGGTRVALLEGDAATETSVREGVREKTVLHFATHAIVREDDPFGSFLALRPSSGGASGDGYLTAREIYGLDLRSGLVVLSACRSGGGQVAGDGIATFARAFLYAGAPSVVTSLWDVADQPTNRMLPVFYRSWMAGQSKARALRVAALALLKDLRAGRVEVATPAGTVRIPEHPVFWAGFALIGEPE